MATDTLTTDMQPHPSQPQLSMETHLLIRATLFATWVARPTQRPPSLYHHHTPHGLQYHVPPILLPRYKHRAYQTTGFGTPQKFGYTKPLAHFFAQGTLNAPNHVPTFYQSPVTLLHKRTFRYFIWGKHATL